MSVIYDHDIRYKISINGIMEAEYMGRQYIAWDRAREICGGRKVIQGGESVRLLMVVRRGTIPIMTPAAMRYFIGSDGIELLDAIAIYFEGPSFLGAHNFINKWASHYRLVPYAFFTDKNEALAWLLDQKASAATKPNSRVELSLSQQYNDVLLDEIPGKVFIVSPDGYIVRANTEACQYLGMDWANLYGRPFSTIRFPDETVMERKALPVGFDGRSETLWIARIPR